MFFTDRFAYVHAPKTGGTFVTSAMFELFGVRWTYAFRLRHLFSTEIERTSGAGTFVYHKNKHGTCSQLPAAQRYKPILATVRNPYDLYVSQYEFGWWKRPELRRYFAALPGFAAAYPRFPDVTFAEFVELYNAAFRAPGSDAVPGGAGRLTQEFVEYYFRDPAAVWPKLDEAYLASPARRDDAFDVHFIKTHRLNQELYDFLVGVGYAPADVEFIRGKGRVLPGGRGRGGAAQAWERYYTPGLRARVRERERLLFALFPEFDAAPVA